MSESYRAASSRRSFFRRAGWGAAAAAAGAGSVPAAGAGEQAGLPAAPGLKSIQEFGVLPSNDAAVNAKNLQEAIDWAAARGAALFVEPADEPYRVAGGLVLRRNASLVGVHGPVGRGTRHPAKPQPVGSVFAVDDEDRPFLTVETATQVRGLQFWYPRQPAADAGRIVAYPPTIRGSHARSAQGVTLSCLTFYGEYLAMDFRAPRERPCEQILIEHCYGKRSSNRKLILAATRKARRNPNGRKDFGALRPILTGCIKPPKWAAADSNCRLPPCEDGALTN